MKKTDNRGLSLIELLIAVTILGIIIVPVLHSFVTSYRVNAKSRETLRATTLAQNEMEIFEKEKMEDLKDRSKFSYEPPTEDPTTGKIEFLKKEVSNDNSGKKLFDVYVTLDPTGDYAVANSQELTTLDNMGSKGSGRFVQPIRTKYKLQSLDEMMYKQFADSSARVGKMRDEEHFKENLQRTIVVDIEKDATNITKAKVTYEYKCLNASLVETGKSVEKKEYPIFDNSSMEDEDGNPIELQSLYVFYAPRYVNNKDKIQINNTTGIEANINIIRMDVLKEGSTKEREPVPSTYKPTIIINDAAKKGKYFTNLNINAAGAVGGLMEGAQAVIIDGASGSGCEANEVNLKNIGSKEKKNRIYKMTVEVYKTGQSKSTSDPLVTLTGTKLE